MAPSILTAPPDLPANLPPETAAGPISPASADAESAAQDVEEHVSEAEVHVSPATSYSRPAWMNRGIAAVAIAAVLALLLFLAFRLKCSEATQAAITSPSVAVLPFANLGENRKDDSFSDGLTEELIDSLVRVPVSTWLPEPPPSNSKARRLMPRKSEKHFMSEPSWKALCGNMETACALRLNWMKPVRAIRSGPKSFDREFKDVLGVQREISNAIVTSLGLSLTGNGTILPADLSSRPSNVDPEAYQSWLKGLYFLNKRTAASD